MLGLIGLLIALALLIYLIAVRNWNIVIVSVVCSIVVIITNGMGIWESLKNLWSGGISNYAMSNFLVLVMAAMFGHLMGKAGCAESIAYAMIRIVGKKHIGITLFLLTALMTYGGINTLVVIFTLYPIGVALISEANLPRKHVLAAIAGGSATFAMTALPGTPSIHNIIPTQYLGTSTMAAPVLGIVASVVMIVLIVGYLLWQEKKCYQNAIGFDPGIHEEGREFVGLEHASEKLPDWRLSILPIIVLLGLVIFLGRTDFIDATGSVVYATAAGIALVCILFYKRFEMPVSQLMTQGMNGGVTAVIGVGALLGFGIVLQGAPVFQKFVDFCVNFNAAPEISIAVAVNIFSGITGSSSGGLVIFMQTMAEKYVELGTNPEVIHRIAAVACGGLDALPHNAAVLIYLSACGLSHKEGYKEIFVTCVIIPLIALVVIVPLAMIGVV